MKRRLTQYLVCPVSGESLALSATRESDDEIMEGKLVSASGRSYMIERGVPRMLAEDVIDKGQWETQAAFSAKWQRAANFGHEEKSRSFYVNWYLNRYKFGTTDHLRQFLTNKKRILDAGTGVGRDTRLYADNCRGEVFGVDISRSIDSAYDHLWHYPNVHLIQADLTQLPFREGFFDFIACDQVLHHTRNTEESFHKLSSRLASGGDLSVYVYRKKAPLREMADDYLRAAASGMSEAEAWALSEQLTELGRALSEINARVTVPDIPALGVRAGEYDVQRLVYWHMLKCYWNGDLEYGDSVITNFDWYRPRYAHRHTADEVRKWFADARLEVITFDECDAGISVRGRKQ
jgi:SAM-dependent methyltransferase